MTSSGRIRLAAALCATMSVLSPSTFADTVVTASKPAQASPPSPQPISNEPWPVLPDGRVVLTVYNHHIAIPQCQECLGVYVNADESSKLADVIRNPRWLRVQALHAFYIGFEGDVGRKGWLDPSGSTDLPSSPQVAITFYREPGRTGCWPAADSSSLPICESLIQAGNGDTGTMTSDGFIEVTGRAPGLFTGATRYVVPLTLMKSAVGLPMYFVCVSNGCGAPESPFTKPGFFIAPDIDIAFNFYEPLYPRSEWLPMFGRVRAALEKLIID